ncbi:MAG: hypothetical protein LUC33_03845 [Prevotellaceae bacterium]|nr:hypothetical protein [Prevotellaceae bacterium]
MGTRRHYKSTLIRAGAIRDITRRHYEVGNNSRCYKSVWRNFVYPIYGCTYGTYLSYLRMPPAEVPREAEDPRQLSLFEFERV